MSCSPLITLHCTGFWMLLGGQGEKGKQIFNDTLNTFYIYGYMASDMSGKEEKQEVSWRLNVV